MEDKYTAVVYNLILRPKKIEFKLDEVDVPEVGRATQLMSNRKFQIPGMFTTFKAGPGKVPLFVEGSAFHDPWHYGKLMGYDKYVSMPFMVLQPV